MGFARLFRNRWAALLWAAGILWTAFDTVGFGPPAKPVQTHNAVVPADEDATGVAVDKNDLAILANAMGGN